MTESTILHLLMHEHGLSQQQAVRALLVITDFAREQFPILEGTINAFVRQEFLHHKIPAQDGREAH